jgi:hypothetical protein
VFLAIGSTSGKSSGSLSKALKDFPSLSAALLLAEPLSRNTPGARRYHTTTFFNRKNKEEKLQ